MDSCYEYHQKIEIVIKNAAEGGLRNNFTCNFTSQISNFYFKSAILFVAPSYVSLLSY